VKVDVEDVLVKIRPVDPRAEKERKKKEKEREALAAAGASGAAASGGTVTSAASTDAQQQAPVLEQAKATISTAGEKLAEAAGAAVPGQSKKKEKKEKAPKQPSGKNAPAPDKPLSPCLIDLRVGLILKAERHPNADSLYVSTIAMGDAPGTENTHEHEGRVVRTVCSGLNGLVPLEAMQRRKIVAVCNLKPVTMRGVKSCAMVLAASPRLAEGETDGHAGPVELVNVPEQAEAGDRVYFEGWKGEPEGVLNPKKKVWETLQPGFTTTQEREVGFDVKGVPQLANAADGEAGEGAARSGLGKLMTTGGVCTVETLKGATVR